MRGKFISLEGIDGAGKSTHHGWLVEFLRQRGLRVVATREPGGTPLGEKLRELLLHESMHLETEALLMFAARREHLDKVILPALERGDWVVSDRFTDASFAYQGGGRGLHKEKLEVLEHWVQAGLQPDLTLFFDVPPTLAQARLAATGDAPDRFEREQKAFFERVRRAYLDRAEREPLRIHQIDATKPIDEIKKSLEKILITIC
ncbi:MAG: dTMP kinase [Betaproteobacteria bacterium]|nr:dTMP kinase [Betaproteobacteria bacterium]